MQANVRVKGKEDMDKQKEKERKREEKELRKIAAANGIKMAKTASLTLATMPVPDSGSLTMGAGMSISTNMSMDVDGGNRVAEPKAGDWASLSMFQGSVHSLGGFKMSGWSTIGPSESSNPLMPAINQLSPLSQTAPSSDHNPTFRNAGWSSLDTTTTQTSESSSSSHGCSSKVESRSDQRWRGSTEPTDSPAPSEPGALQSLPSMPPLPSTIPPAQIPQAMPVRSNWQQFQKGTSRRK